MRRKRTSIAIVLIIAALILGIGYASISNIPLNITGSAEVAPSDENFKVKFDDTAEIIKVGSINASVTGEKTAEMHVTGLTAKDQVATATFTIKNESPDLAASLSAATPTNTNTEYFSVDYYFGEKTEDEPAKTATLNAQNSTTVTVIITVLKTPVEDKQDTTIGLSITAAPPVGQ